MAGGVWGFRITLSFPDENATLRRPPRIPARRLHACVARLARASGPALLREGACGRLAAAFLRRPPAPLAPRLRSEPRVRHAAREARYAAGPQRGHRAGRAHARGRRRDPRLARRTG